jgi:hypothetical protein
VPSLVPCRTTVLDDKQGCAGDGQQQSTSWQMSAQSGRHRRARPKIANPRFAGRPPPLCVDLPPCLPFVLLARSRLAAALSWVVEGGMNSTVRPKRCGELVIGLWHGGLCFEDGEACGRVGVVRWNSGHPRQEAETEGQAE